MARDLALLGVPYDSWRLYKGDDPQYENWLSLVADLVARARTSKSTPNK